MEEELEKPIQYVKGVGERVSQLLAKKQIRCVEDALYFFPWRYEDRRRLLNVSEVEWTSEKTFVVGRIRSAQPVFYSRSKRRFYRVSLEDLQENFRVLTLTWFRKPYIFEKLNTGTLIIAGGKLQNFRGQLQIVHPEIEVLGKTIEEGSKEIVGIYSQTEGLYQKTIRKIERSVISSFSSILQDPIPPDLLEKHGLPQLAESVYAIHRPPKEANIEELNQLDTRFHHRMIYGEFFLFSLGLAMNRKLFQENKGIAFPKPQSIWEQIGANFEFRFTKAQKRVVAEVLEDMQQARPMHRLIQGDVGSGKTAVSAAAAAVALEAGYQVAFMAPTEVLVRQHIEKFKKWFKGSGVEFSLLTGSVNTKERRDALEEIKKEGPRIIFGTHALFEQEVQFSSLGMVIVDEQHRFGVHQRARLVEKGKTPDVLVMTATPIPRSLALTLYGDLDVSSIDELPPGRKPIQTKLYLEKKRPQMIKALTQELQKGYQAYVVFPLIEESEKLALKSIERMLPEWKKQFSDFRVEVLHGRLKAEEKLRLLNEFRDNQIQILMSTTVVEVGVDVPNASVMVIENAERFGLSQLHQLRGRIGRSELQSYCFLMAEHFGSEDTKKRLQSMEKTQDGFQLSEIDLQIRGPGEFFGTRQSGVPEFQFSRLPKDLHWLQKARQDAADILQKSAELDDYPLLKEEMQKRIRKLHVS